MMIQNDQQRTSESASEIKLSVSTMAYGLAKKGVITPAEADGLNIMIPKLIAQAKQAAISQGQAVPPQQPMRQQGPPPGMMQRPGMGGGPGLQRFSPNARSVDVR